MTAHPMPDAALLPCPFCGSGFKMGQEPADNYPVAGMFYLYHDYGPLKSPARDCLIDVPRHFTTEAAAIAAWNRRAGQAHERRAAMAATLELAAEDLRTWIDSDGFPIDSADAEDGAYTAADWLLSRANELKETDGE